MKLALSICIPTMNRPEYLLQAINSVLADNSSLSQIEVCISNNCSESDYSEVECRIKEASHLCKIIYIRHASRIPLDENHHYVTKMASADHIYFLGDDDYILSGQMPKLVEFTKTKDPDLAIFNGLLVDAGNCYLGKHFNLPPVEYKSLESAFRNLRDKGSFGAVLVRKNLLQDDDFRQLYSTDHAYGCYWLSIFRKYERGEQLKIYIPDFPCVALRCAQKNYNHIYVYYKTIPLWLEICKRLAGLGVPKQLISEHFHSSNKLISSARFMLQLADTGCDLDLIKKANPSFFNKHIIKIKFCKYFYILKGYHALKILYRKFIKKSFDIDSDSVAENINLLNSTVRR